MRVCVCERESESSKIELSTWSSGVCVREREYVNVCVSVRVWKIKGMCVTMCAWKEFIGGKRESKRVGGGGGVWKKHNIVTHTPFLFHTRTLTHTLTYSLSHTHTPLDQVFSSILLLSLSLSHTQTLTHTDCWALGLVQRFYSLTMFTLTHTDYSRSLSHTHRLLGLGFSLTFLPPDNVLSLTHTDRWA